MTVRSSSREGTPSGSASGLIQGGMGGPEDELLEDGQEEVFSRSEVEGGVIEHLSEAGGDTHDA